MIKHPDLENRFQPPQGLEGNRFVNPKTGHDIYYEYVIPDGAKTCALILPGLADFCPIYYETAHDLLSRDIGVFLMNFQYMGMSERFQDTEKRHSDGFDMDVSDVHYLITHHIKPIYNDPIIMMGHSTGANISLRTLASYPDIAACAAFTAPLLGIRGFQRLPLTFWVGLAHALKPFWNSYVPFGGPWNAGIRASTGSGKFSHDPVRDAIHNMWAEHYPPMRRGDPTIRWVYEALKSMQVLQQSETFTALSTPCLFAVAENDKIVDGKKSSAFAQKLKTANIISFEKCGHEILLESDDIRNQFWVEFDKMVERKIGS